MARRRRDPQAARNLTHRLIVPPSCAPGARGAAATLPRRRLQLLARRLRARLTAVMHMATVTHRSRPTPPPCSEGVVIVAPADAASPLAPGAQQSNDQTVC